MQFSVEAQESESNICWHFLFFFQLRVVFYIMHVLAENEAAQFRGHVLIVNLKVKKLLHMNAALNVHRHLSLHCVSAEGSVSNCFPRLLVC